MIEAGLAMKEDDPARDGPLAVARGKAMASAEH
jgi:hypothetical protein